MRRPPVATADGPWAKARLSRELRRGRSGHLARRRFVIGCQLAATAAMEVITLYQAGIIRELPEPRGTAFGRPWDAERVDASDEAYDLLSMPHSPLAMLSFATTTMLAGLGGEDRHRRTPWVPRALALKAAFDALYAAKLVRDQATRYEAWCVWCLVAAAGSLAAFPATLPEALSARRGR